MRILIGVLLVFSNCSFLNNKFNSVTNNQKLGDVLDSIDGVYVYYNGSVGNVSGRNLSKDGYNFGLKFQCVEFVKRYYFLHFKHKMPNSYGHAKTFFDKSLKDAEFNKERGLFQFSNPSSTKPLVGDILVFDATLLNSFGHVAIVSRVNENEIELIQQNPGQYVDSRKKLDLEFSMGKWEIKSKKLLGWLSKKQNL